MPWRCRTFAFSLGKKLAFDKVVLPRKLSMWSLRSPYVGESPVHFEGLKMCRYVCYFTTYNLEETGFADSYGSIAENRSFDGLTLKVHEIFCT